MSRQALLISATKSLFLLNAICPSKSSPNGDAHNPSSVIATHVPDTQLHPGTSHVAVDFIGNLLSLIQIYHEIVCVYRSFAERNAPRQLLGEHITIVKRSRNSTSGAFFAIASNCLWHYN